MGNGAQLTVTPVADGPTVGSKHLFGGVMAGIDGTATDATRNGA
jgi:hypothetical protein